MLTRETKSEWMAGWVAGVGMLYNVANLTDQPDDARNCVNFWVSVCQSRDPWSCGYIAAFSASLGTL